MTNFEYYKTNIKSKEAYEKMTEKINGSATIPSFVDWLKEEYCDDYKKVHNYLFTYSVRFNDYFSAKWSAFPYKSASFLEALYKFMQFIDKYETANKDKLRIVEIKEDDKVLLDEDGTQDHSYSIVYKREYDREWKIGNENLTYKEAIGKITEYMKTCTNQYRIMKGADGIIYGKYDDNDKKNTKNRHYKFGYMAFENREHTLSHTNYFECWDTDFVKAMDRFVNWMQNRCTFGYSYDIAWEDGAEIFNRADNEKKEYLKLKKKYHGDDDVNRYAELNKKYGYLDGKENN